MDDSGWSRVYFMLLVLLVILMPLAGYVAVSITTTTAQLAGARGWDLPSSTAFFVRLGAAGHAAVGAAGLLVVVAVARWRDSRQAALACIVIFVVCMGFYLFSALSSHLAVTGWTRWRLGPPVHAVGACVTTAAAIRARAIAGNS